MDPMGTSFCWTLAEAPSCRRFGMTTEKPLQPRLKIEVSGWERGLGILKFMYIYTECICMCDRVCDIAFKITYELLYTYVVSDVTMPYIMC